MIRYTNECRDCATESYPCKGDSCPNRRVRRLFCDRCGWDYGKLCRYDGEEVCEECLLKGFEVLE